MNQQPAEQTAVERAIDFMEAYVREPPQVAVLMATSRMDYLIGQVLAARLLPCPGAQDELLDSERGFGSLSARIALAYRVGVIDASLARVLHIFRRIRNDFAHSFDKQSLEDSPHADRIAELVRAFSRSEKYRRSCEVLQRDLGVGTPTVVAFILASSYAIARLETLLEHVERVSDDAAWMGEWTA